MKKYLLPNELMIGDALLYDKNSEISSTIDVITKSRVGHASMVTEINPVFVHEAQPEGYIKTELFKSCKDCYHIYVKRPRFEFNAQKLQVWCRIKEGTPYDFKGTVIQQFLKNVFGKKINHSDALKLYCSEADLRAWNESSNMNFNPEQSPGDILYNFVDFETFELKLK